MASLHHLCPALPSGGPRYASKSVKVAWVLWVVRQTLQYC